MVWNVAVVNWTFSWVYGSENPRSQSPTLRLGSKKPYYTLTLQHPSADIKWYMYNGFLFWVNFRKVYFPRLSGRQ
jgi:hypothetical protein